MGNSGSSTSPANALAALAFRAGCAGKEGRGAAPNFPVEARPPPSSGFGGRAAAPPASLATPARTGVSSPGTALSPASRARPLASPAFSARTARSGARAATDRRYLDLLTEEQQQAAMVPHSVPLLIKAAAGSGKTLVLTSRILHMIQGGVSPGEVLALTFSRKAARELEERVHDVLHDHRASELTVCTFHALALRLLRAHPRVPCAPPHGTGARGMAPCPDCGSPAPVSTEQQRDQVLLGGGGSGGGGMGGPPPRPLVIDAEKRRTMLRRCAAGYLFVAGSDRRPTCVARPPGGGAPRVAVAQSAGATVGGCAPLVLETARQLLVEWGKDGEPTRTGEEALAEWPAPGEAAPPGQGHRPQRPEVPTPFGRVPPALVHGVQQEVVARLEAALTKTLREHRTTVADSGDSDLERRILAAYQALLDALGGLDLAAFVPRALAMLRGHEAMLAAVRHRYRYVVCDEFQDVSASQMALVALVAGPDRRVTACGDDDQAIYGWRGSAPHALRQFPALFPGCRVAALSENFRSTSTIVEAAQCVIRRNRGRDSKEVRATRQGGPKLELLVSSNPDAEGLRIADAILRHYRAGEWRLGDVAVLARTRAVRDSVSRRLRRTGIRSVVAGRSLSASSPYAWSEVRDALAWMALACGDRQGGDEAFQRVCNTPPRGMSARVVAALGRARDAVAAQPPPAKRRADPSARSASALAALQAVTRGEAAGQEQWTLLRVARCAVDGWGLSAASPGRASAEAAGADGAEDLRRCPEARSALDGLSERQRMAVAGMVEIVGGLAAACRTQGPEDMVRTVIARTGAEEMMRRRADQDAARGRVQGRAVGGSQSQSQSHRQGAGTPAPRAASTSVEQRRHALCLLMEDARWYAERLARGTADRVVDGGGGSAATGGAGGSSINHTSSISSSAAAEGNDGKGTPNVQAALRVGAEHLRAFLREARAIAEQEQAARPAAGTAVAPLTRDADCVTLSTIHQAKGLEWDVVIVARFNDGVLPLPPREADEGEEMEALDMEAAAAEASEGGPDLGRGRRRGQKLPATSAGASGASSRGGTPSGGQGRGQGQRRSPMRVEPTAQATPSAAEQLEEERRLFYVAMTRARRALYLSFCQFLDGGRVAEPSQFLHDIPSRFIAGEEQPPSAGAERRGPSGSPPPPSADDGRRPAAAGPRAGAGTVPSQGKPSSCSSVGSNPSAGHRGPAAMRRPFRGRFRAPRRVDGYPAPPHTPGRHAESAQQMPPPSLATGPVAAARSQVPRQLQQRGGGGSGGAGQDQTSPPQSRMPAAQARVRTADSTSPPPPAAEARTRPVTTEPPSTSGGVDDGIGLFPEDVAAVLEPSGPPSVGKEAIGCAERQAEDGPEAGGSAVVPSFAERCECPCHGQADRAWRAARGRERCPPRQSPRRAHPAGPASRGTTRAAACKAMVKLSSGQNAGTASDSSLRGGGDGGCDWMNTPSDSDADFEAMPGSQGSDPPLRRPHSPALNDAEVALGWTLSGRALCRHCAYHQCSDAAALPT